MFDRMIRLSKAFMKKISILFALTCCALLAEEHHYNVIFDPHFSPYVGADDLITTHELLENSKFCKLSSKYLSEQQSFLGGVGRFSELFFYLEPSQLFILSIATRSFRSRISDSIAT